MKKCMWNDGKLGQFNSQCLRHYLKAKFVRFQISLGNKLCALGLIRNYGYNGNEVWVKYYPWKLSNIHELKYRFIKKVK